jgi:cyclic beta-1,2-glucan synthetase
MEPLLQEKTPGRTSSGSSPEPRIAADPHAEPLRPRRLSSPHAAQPVTHLLSNGRYSVLLTAAGSGYSRWGELAVTRWVADATLDAYGSYVFVRDVSKGRVWSAGYQPVGVEPDEYRVLFEEGRAEIGRRDGPIETTTEFLVASEDDVELRIVSLLNRDSWVHELELTSYAEVVLTTPGADAGHPAFSKMFVQTEWVAERGLLLARRRPREAGDHAAFAAHGSALEGEASGALQFETDRAKFLGRGHELREALAVIDPRTLSNSSGTVLDPVLALRRRIRIQPGATARVLFWTAAAGEREALLDIASTYSEMRVIERTRSLATAGARASRARLGIEVAQAQCYQRLAGEALYGTPAAAAAGVGAADEEPRGGPPALWASSVSGDRPIVLVRLAGVEMLDIAAQLARCAAPYWRSLGCAIDLVLLIEAPAPAELEGALARALGLHGAPGAQSSSSLPASIEGVRVLRAAMLSSESRSMLAGAARVTLRRREDLEGRAQEPGTHPSAAARPVFPPAGAAMRTDPPRSLPALEFFNGLGGFAAAGREYLIVLDAGQRTPAPWVNVLANPQFGALVSSDALGSTWSINARENQLTAWGNDPVSNVPSEVVYLKDEASGEVWTPTPLPVRDANASYVVRHGFGYTRFEHDSHGIGIELLEFVPLEDPVKVGRLRLVNRTEETRRLSVTHYLEWVLGSQRSRTASFIVTELDGRTGALLARNPWSMGFESRVAFMDLSGPALGSLRLSGDRREFVGRHGSLAEPAALVTGTPLSMRVGAGLDPCGALQGGCELAPGEQVEIRLLLGQEASRGGALELVERWRNADLDAALRRVTEFWEATLGGVQVKTPDRSMDVLLNGWLLYQTLSSRLWGRTGFYQTSGAWGYRDQLQDSMAVCAAQPAIAREHILRAAGRQFPEGDVQHWWLPGSGAGVRTRVADDKIWLPFVVAHYLETTGDSSLLEEAVPFLEGPPLAPGQIDAFYVPTVAAQTGSIYEHCVRALDSSLAIGSHGLPLFGTGDWNDGMNRVGAGGRGESVWMGWFLHLTLLEFAKVAERRVDAARAALWRKHAFSLKQAIEREAWDGDWYRRGYYDDGAPLGSVSSEECRIDSIAQSWGVISGAAEPDRAQRAMAAVNAQLVSRSEGMVYLFTPPFDRTRRDPGYIKAYPPGLRENGGQYTHAALWTTLAFARLGDGDRAHELFSLLNPINHSSTRAAIHRYKVEPYVVCADLYSAPAHVGRGGWTWYTGSAGWMYRVGLEGILGVHRRGAVLHIEPCIPRAWSGFEVTYKQGASRYHIAVENPSRVNRGIVRATLDEREIAGSPCDIELKDDGSYHFVRVTLG